MQRVIDLAIGPWRFIIRRLGKRYQVRYKFNKKHLVIDLFLFFGVVGLVVANFYIAFVFTKFATSLQVRLDVSLPESVISGEETVIHVSYENNSKKNNVNDAVLTLEFPAGVVIKESTDQRYSLADQSLNIGNIRPLKAGGFDLTAEIWGDHQKEYKIYARLDYTQESTLDERVNWQEEQLVSVSYRPSGSVVGCQWNFPGVVVAGNLVDFKLNCQNNYAAELSGLHLEPTWPQGVKLVASNPDLVGNTWIIGKQASGESATWSGQLQITNEINNDAVLSGRLYGKYLGQAILLDELKQQVEVFHPKFEIVGSVNNQDNYALVAGETLKYSFSYTNGEEQKIKNAFVIFDLSDPLYSLATLKTQTDYSLAGKTVSFNLGDLDSGQKGNIDFEIGTVKKFSRSSVYLDLEPKVKYSIEYAGDEFLVESSQPIVRTLLSSDLTLTAFARYYSLEGEQLGIGPIPPIVGFPTEYRIFWQINNTINPVTDVVVSGTLPNNVIWTGDEAMNIEKQLDFDRKTRQITLHLDRLESAGGGGVLPVLASFALELTPQASQVGSAAILLRDVSISGQDSVTGRKLEDYLGSITTNLVNDKLVTGRGQVIGL